MNKNEWINEVMASADQIKRVSVPPQLFDSIQNKLQFVSVQKVSKKWLFAAAASVLVLLVCNVAVMAKKQSQPNINNTVGALLDLNTTNQLYSEK